MNVVFLCHMFPNKISPYTAPFMYERAKSISSYINLDVIAPASYFPVLRTNLPPYSEVFGSLTVYHPRYIALPNLLWSLRWIPYLNMLKKMSIGTWEKCDLIHIEWIYPDAYATLKFAKSRRIKTTAVIHGNEAIDFYGPNKRWPKYGKVLANVDRIIAVSMDLKNKVVERYGIDPNKITVIHNGVDLKKFVINDKIKARKELGIDTTSKVGISVARLSDEKNLDFLIKAIEKVSDKSLLFFIIGEGPLHNKLQSLIDLCMVGDRVKLVGPVEHNEVARWINASDFFCLPSKREGCPVVIHEALSCGKPVISTKVGAIPDLITHDEYGLLCDHSNVEALADLLQKAINTTWDAEKIHSYGANFTWEKMAKQTIKIFEEVLF